MDFLDSFGYCVTIIFFGIVAIGCMMFLQSIKNSPIGAHPCDRCDVRKDPQYDSSYCFSCKRGTKQ